TAGPRARRRAYADGGAALIGRPGPPHDVLLDAMGRRLRSPRLPGVDVPGVDASMSPRPQPRRAMRWADVYVCMLADGVALRNRCPPGQADPRAAIAGGAFRTDPAATNRVKRSRGSAHPPRGVSALWRALSHDPARPRPRD